MWEKPETRVNVMRELERALGEDQHFSDGHVISSMCTAPLDIAKQAHALLIESNLGNAGIYAGTLRLEKQEFGALSHVLGDDGRL